MIGGKTLVLGVRFDPETYELVRSVALARADKARSAVSMSDVVRSLVEQAAEGMLLEAGASHRDFTTEIAGRIAEAQRRAEERGRITIGVRWEALRASKFRCQHCGRAADQSELVVDHVVPISRGGTSEQSNLQALCRDCNAGKGAKTEEAA